MLVHVFTNHVSLLVLQPKAGGSSDVCCQDMLGMECRVLCYVMLCCVSGLASLGTPVEGAITRGVALHLDHLRPRFISNGLHAWAAVEG